MSEVSGLADQDGAGDRGRLTGRACDFAGLLLLVMAVLIGVEILIRSVLGKSTLVADEYSGYLFVWITMIGFLHALRIGSFLRVNILVGRFGPKGQAITELLSSVAGIVVSAICVYATSTLVLASLRFGTLSIQPSATPLWIPQLILPLGFVGLLALYLASLIEASRRLRAGSP